MKIKSRRPAAVTAAGWMIILMILFNLGLIAYTYFQEGSLDAIIRINLFTSGGLTPQSYESIFLVTAVVINLIVLICAVGFLRLKRWAWISLAFLIGLALLINLVRYYLDVPDYIYMLVYTILALLLNQSEIQTAFGIRKSRDEQLA